MEDRITLRSFVENVVLQSYLTNNSAQTVDQVTCKSLLCPKFPEKCFIWRSRQANREHYVRLVHPIA